MERSGERGGERIAYSYLGTSNKYQYILKFNVVYKKITYREFIGILVRLRLVKL